MSTTTNHNQTGPAPRQAAPSEADLMVGALAASLEQLAVNTYGAALDAATSGALGDVPPAVAEFVTVARQQHQAALDAWNGVLTSAGKPAVTAPPADLEASVNGMFARVTDIAGAAQLALWLEQVAASTYLFAIGNLQSPAAINLAGSIFPIDRQHISVLLFALGMYPVPETFANTQLAYTGGGAMPPGATAPETK
ncbi:MAG: ferritin-like domain-containing protein [Ilumatobacteraceae bacterium]